MRLEKRKVKGLLMFSIRHRDSPAKQRFVFEAPVLHSFQNGIDMYQKALCEQRKTMRIYFTGCWVPYSMIPIISTVGQAD